ncbi:hypothetical protein HPP92_021828 [Vanilla planifolia]|uniref:DUF4378 domain-containing protein n=1 Tax=Vanilla planifolia TaxID=51239 RepID=A0A835PU74_VANPL|nr:hypothetical protein HPP92_022149 [Vanilla planifolia]KAG0458700.1 hypothetical protein HPP92_021828 [Vanilla planifolia]
MTKQPLTLKEYLELESSLECPLSTPPRAYGTTIVRSLLETELHGGADKSSPSLAPSCSMVVVTRLSSIVQSLSTSSLSKRIKRGLWKRCDRKKVEKGFEQSRSSKEHELKRRSPIFLSPVSSRPSSSPQKDASELLLSSIRSSCLFLESGEKPPSTSPTPTSCPDTNKGMLIEVVDSSSPPTTGNLKPEEKICEGVMCCHSEEEKEQFSPMSVLDFPYQRTEPSDEEVELSTSTPCFRQRITILKGDVAGTKNLPLQKMQRLEILGRLDPSNLFHCIAYSEVDAESTVDREKDAGFEENWRRVAIVLFRRLSGGTRVPMWAEQLLFDFFAEEVSMAEQSRWKTRTGTRDDELLHAAAAWLSDAGGEVGEDSRVSWTDMQMCVLWRRFEEEEAVMAAEMTIGVVAWLVNEVMDELLLS